MLDVRHYRDIRIKEASIAHELHERVVHAVHRCHGAGHPVGLAWPDYRLEPATLGLTLRAFGSADALNMLADHLAPLVNAGLIDVGDTADTPETEARVTFYRDRAAEKGEGYLARQNRHEAKKGRPQRKRVTRRKAPFYVRMRSQTTAQGYSLFINVVTGENAPRGGASYGLGYPVPQFKEGA